MPNSTLYPHLMIRKSPCRALFAPLLAVSLLGMPAVAPSQAPAPATDDPERWAGDMARLAARDAESAPPEDCLLFVGSSSIRLWDLEVYWPKEKALNNGFGGSVLADSIRHFEQVIAPYRPRAVVVYAGDNDIARGYAPERVRDDFRDFAGLVREAHPEVPVVFIAIKPSIRRWEMWPQMREANELVAALCEGDELLHYADIASPMLPDDGSAPDEKWFVRDGLHLSEWAYGEWSAIVTEVLEEAGVALR